MKQSLDPSSSAPRRAPEPAIEQLLRRTSQIAGLALFGVAATMLFLHWTTRATAGWASRARDAGRIARQLQLLAEDRETGVRGYLITANPVSLGPETAARRDIGPKLDSLAMLADPDDGASAAEEVAAVRRALARWDLTFAQPILAAAAAGRPAVSRDSLAGKLLFDDVREAIARVNAGVDEAYARHLSASRRWEWVADAVLLAEVLLLVVALSSVRGRISAHTREMSAKDADLEAQNATLREQHHMLNEQAAELEVQALELEEANHNLELAMESVRDAEAEARGLLMERDAVLAAVTDIAVILDADGQCLRIPSIDQPLLGRPPAEVIGTRVSESLEPETAQAMLSTIRRALGTGRRAELEYQRTLDGETGWRLGVAAPIAAGEVLWVARDISASKKARTRLEEQLRQSQKMEAIGRLAGGVAHDFNNLLAVIRGYAALMLQTDVTDPDMLESLREIVGAADRATTLTRQLLLFSRHRPADPEPIDLNAAVEGLTAMLSSLIGAHIELVRDLRVQPLIVPAERSQLDQVIVNLMVNARDAMPQGGRVTISTRRYDPAVHGDLPGPRGATDYAVLTVMDTGVGMDETTKSQIFEPFFTTKQEGKGTGIGLSTVYAIVQQTGGFLRVESAPGVGSRFEVVLPLAMSPAAAPVPAARPPSRRGNESVLIVEDQDSLRTLLRRWLRGNGYIVYEAENGRAALELFAEHRNDIAAVITDVVMPVLGGRQLAEALAEQAPTLPVVFMSGFTGDFPVDGDTSQILEMFLQKPFTREEVLAKLREALDRSAVS